MNKKIEELIKQQPTLDSINPSEIKQKLQSGRIIERLLTLKGSRHNDVFLVQLDNNLLAVFKGRDGDIGSRKNEVMAFEIAYNLFKLEHTIPPTIEKEYLGIKGSLQYYVAPSIELNDTSPDYRSNLRHLISEISKDELSKHSYADLQIFKFVTGIIDVNINGLIAWKNRTGQFYLTYVDNEWLFGSSSSYGETTFGKTDITKGSFAYPTDGFNSSYTSFFNAKTIMQIATINEENLITLFKTNGYKVHDACVKIFLRNCQQVVAAFKLTNPASSLKDEQESLSVSYGL